MSLYVTGTVNMTNNSAAVVGVGTAFVANVAAGDGFLIVGETVYYTVLSITDDTHLTLSVNYAGVTGTGKTYQIARDWTANLGLAEIQPGDPNWPYLLTQKALRKIDTDLAPKASPVFTTQITTPKIITASGNLEITPAGNNDIILQGSGTGNVGIGTSAQITKLRVKPDSANDGVSIEGFNTAATRGFFGLDSSGGGLIYLLDSVGTQIVQISTQGVTYFNSGNVGIGTVTPTAVLAIKAGTAAANTAPLKLIAGTNLTTPENGAIEFDGTNLYITIAGIRKTIQVA